MAAIPIGTQDPIVVISASAAATVAPDDETDGFLCGADGGIVRTYVTYAGAVTAAALRLWVRNRESGFWFKGASTADIGALAPTTDGTEARDWFVGEGVEFTFQLESISPSGGAPTVAVDVVGVSS